MAKRPIDALVGKVSTAKTALPNAEITRVIAAMPPDEQQALMSGHRDSGYAGSLEDFAQEQANLYRTAPEGDPRLKTFFYGNTLQRLWQAMKPGRPVI